MILQDVPDVCLATPLGIIITRVDSAAAPKNIIGKSYPVWS